MKRVNIVFQIRLREHNFIVRGIMNGPDHSVGIFSPCLEEYTLYDRTSGWRAALLGLSESEERDIEDAAFLEWQKYEDELGEELERRYGSCHDCED